MKRPFVLLGCPFAFAVLATTGTAHAQREIGVGVSYDPRMPLGSLHDLVPNPGVAGVQGKWEYYPIDQRLAVGFYLQYNYFQKGPETTTVAIQNGAATAPFTRYAYFLSLIPTIRYFPLGPGSRVARPYAELGTGIADANSGVLASDLSRRTNGAAFVVQPSVGVLWAIVSKQSEPVAGLENYPNIVPRTRETMFGIVTSAAWTFTTADLISASNVSYVGVQVGVYTKL